MPSPLHLACRALAALPALAALLAAEAGDAAAQLRPLDPIRWDVFAEGRTVIAEAGGAGFRDQRASLAGTTGDLWEAGNYRVAWRSGRVMVEAGGTVQRFFRDRARFAEPDPEVEPDDDGRRHDSGDHHIQTVVRLTPENARVTGALRFGTRLPTTDNKTGLDRDATDFFFTLGARTARGRVAAEAEAGLGIFGTRQQRFEQDDLLVYVLGAELGGGAVAPSLRVVGQKVASSGRQIRGNEDLGELRLGLRAGRGRWLRLEVVRGFEPASPELGAILWLGRAW